MYILYQDEMKILTKRSFRDTIFRVSVGFLKYLMKHIVCYYRPPEGGRLYDMKVVSGYVFLRTYYV